MYITILRSPGEGPLCNVIYRHGTNTQSITDHMILEWAVALVTSVLCGHFCHLLPLDSLVLDFTCHSGWRGQYLGRPRRHLVCSGDATTQR